jgi:hypothetical protein
MKNALLRGSLSFAISCVTAGVLFAQQVPGAQPNVAERAGVGEDPDPGHAHHERGPAPTNVRLRPWCPRE